MEVKIIVPKFPNGIAIGEERENLAVPVVVDYTAWIEQHGAGALQILLQRPQDADPYPVTVTNDNGEAVWTPNETDMNFKGRGEIQLVYTAGGVIERSPVIMVISGRSLVAAGDPPDPFETWLEELTELAAETLVNAQSAEDSASEANADALRAAQSALDAEAAKSGAEAAETAARQSAAIAREKAAEAAEAAQIAGREADYAQQQNIAAGYSAESAHDDAERAAQSEEDAQSAASAAAASAAVAQELIDQIPDIEAEIDTKAPAIYESIGPAAIASFADGADDMPLRQLVVDIPVTQEGSGDPSPENVRPCVARTDVSVTRTGKNLFDKTKYEYGRYLNQGSGTTSVSVGTPKWDVSDYIRVKGDTVYTSSPWGISTRSEWCYYDSNRRFISGVSSAARRQRTPPNAVYLRVDFPHPSLNSFQLEEGSSATPTQAYEGEVVDIDWADVAGTVYGGALTINADGSGEVKNRYYYLDGGNLAWTKDTSSYPYTIFRYNLNSMYANNEKVGVLCTQYPSTTKNAANSAGDNHVWMHYVSAANHWLVVRDDSKADMTAAEFKAAMSGVMFAIQRVTPATYQLTIEQIRMLAGVNNIWSNAGDVTVEYAADTKSYIDKSIRATRQLIAGIETGMTASRAYSVGELLIVGDTLYRVIAAIANGATLTPETNVTTTTVAEQLLLLANT